MALDLGEYAAAVDATTHGARVMGVHHRRPRRYFKITEIRLMEQWADEGKSQSYASRMLDRDPGVIAQAALRYGIRFHAKPGNPVRTAPEVKRQQRAHHCRLYRHRRGAKPRVFKRDLVVTRFDDPRVMA